MIGITGWMVAYLFVQEMVFAVGFCEAHSVGKGASELKTQESILVFIGFFRGKSF